MPSAARYHIGYIVNNCQSRMWAGKQESWNTWITWRIDNSLGSRGFIQINCRTPESVTARVRLDKIPDYIWMQIARTKVIWVCITCEIRPRSWLLLGLAGDLCKIYQVIWIWSWSRFILTPYLNTRWSLTCPHLRHQADCQFYDRPNTLPGLMALRLAGLQYIFIKETLRPELWWRII